jgi:tryptophan halogenase
MKLKNIIIVGGGSAGFMTAATLLNQLPNSNITLIESPNIKTVGVGESTITGIKHWTKLLGIDDKDFLKATDGTYKLSIKFTDFYKKGEAFHYPFGEPDINGCSAGLNDWWFKKFSNPKIKNSDYADSYFASMSLVNNNKLFYNDDRVMPFNFDYDTAYHFDATKFSIWLRDTYCKKRKLKHIKEDIKTIETDKNGIKSLNKKYKADLFIDCTGFKSLLLDKTLKEPFESYEDLLPNNSAVATRIPYTNKEKQLVPYTNCTAIENGWVWNIPLWSRMGTGYVYSDNYISDDKAVEQFEKHLGLKNLEYNKIKMRVGIHKRLWVKNVVAIGLSAGFIEPLESNGLYTVHTFLMKFLRNVQREKISQWDKDNFTYQCKFEFRTFAEFVAMHYALSHRTDTKYWKDLFNKDWSSKLNTLENNSHVYGITESAFRRHQNYHFDPIGGLHCIAAGMNWGPTDLPSVMYHNQQSLEEFKKQWITPGENLRKRKKYWDIVCKKLPSYIDFLKHEIYGI